MPLAPGARLGPYEIEAPLGAGGMGEVYRARDTRLARSVALKVLPSHLAASAELRARLEREARAVSSLNHPHICTLFDVGRDAGTDYLVMELVEGETLAQKLERGALPLEQTLRYGAEIADALAKAHAAGIVHRDLKPGNVMLTKAGVKLLDFGLARAPEGNGASTTSGASQLATVAQPLTVEGSFVGTFQYMAPEQLEGGEIDARADLWALGCVLYEMATGKRAFDGKSQASVISSILKDEPRPMREMVPLSPGDFERVVRTCLAKDPDERWHSAADLCRELRWIASGGARAEAPVPRARGGRWAWIVAVLALALAAWSLWHGLAGKRGDPHLRTVLMHDAQGEIGTVPADVAISPDGKQVAYVAATPAGKNVWVRALDAPAPRKLSDLGPAQDPFWSPDGRTIGFTTSRDNAKLWKMPAEGGTPLSICDVKWARGASWGTKNVIVFAPAPAGPLYAVPASGGEPRPVTELDPARHETGHRMPWFLPDGEHFLFVALPQSSQGYDVFAGSLSSKSVKKLMTAGSSASYAEPGYLLFVREGKLVAQPFDAARLELKGEPVPLDVPPQNGSMAAARVATASRDGRLAMLKNPMRDSRLEWLGRGGDVLGTLPFPPGMYIDVAASPDGQSALAVRAVTDAQPELWHVDTARGTVRRIGPERRSDAQPTWFPDGRSFAYASIGEGGQRVFVESVDAPGEARLVPALETEFQNPRGVTPDGRTLIVAAMDPATEYDLWAVPVDGSGKPRPVARTPAREGGGAVSPDGRWLALSSHETGRNEVYVQPYPGPGPKTRVSQNGGRDPQWTKGGAELLYVEGGSLMAAPIEPGPALRVGRPRELFRRDDSMTYSATADGERILTATPIGVAFPTIAVTFDWTAEMAP
jgi:eukaryotic-like serine/threonine-protein kinase